MELVRRGTQVLQENEKCEKENKGRGFKKTDSDWHCICFLKIVHNRVARIQKEVPNDKSSRKNESSQK